MNNALVYIGGFLILALATLFAVPHFIDWNGYRGVFEEEASRVLGREVRVGGDVSLRILPSPYVSFGKLRIADVDGATGRPMFRAEAFTMWLSIPPLLKGIIQAENIELVKPVLELATDGKGSGNWSKFSITPGTLPFIPQDVALQSVNITDGSIGLSGPNGVQLTRLEGIAGELTADALDGPYKFKGKLEWNGDERQIKLATAKPEANGDIRFKASVGSAALGGAFLLDGRLSDLASAPKLTGEIAAKLKTNALAVASSPGPSPSATVPETHAATPSPIPALAPTETVPPNLDFRSKVDGDTNSLVLTDIVISVDNDGPPQLVTGEARVDWTERKRLDVSLAAKWIDFDRLTGAGSDSVPIETALRLFDLLVVSFPGELDANATLSFDQIHLGGDAISGVRLTASREGGPLLLKDLRAGLPGGAQLSLQGELATVDAKQQFAGAISLSGRSLLRFLNWGFRDSRLAEARSDGPFSIEGHLSLGSDVVALREATAELNGTPLLGEVTFGLKAPRRLSVALEGQRIDTAQFWTGGLGLSGLRGLVTGIESATKPERSGFAAGLFDPKGTDLVLSLKAGELVDGDRSLRDVEADVTLDGGRLTMPVLKFSTPEGLSLEMEGTATGVPDRGVGTLRGVVSAPNPEAAEDFARLFDLSKNERDVIERVKRVAPLRLATVVSFGERTDAAIDVSVDGVVQGGRIVASARLDSARSNWRDALADLTASFDSPDVGKLLASVAGKDGPSAGAAAAPARPGSLFVKMAGTPAQGLVSVAQLVAPGLNLSYNGRFHADGDEGLRSQGDLDVVSADARDVLRLVGVNSPLGLEGAPVEGRVAVTSEQGRLTLASSNLKIASSKVTGIATLLSKDGGRTDIAADVAFDELMLAQLLSPLTGRAEPPPEPVASPQQSRSRQQQAAAPKSPPAADVVWPNATFDFSMLDSLGGTVKADIRTLALEPGLVMRDAVLDVVLEPGRVRIVRLEGAAVGGKASATMSFERQPAGARCEGKMRIDVSSQGVSETSASDETMASDVAALQVSFAGNALTPLGLISVLEGTGELHLGDVTLTGVAPQAVSRVADAAMQQVKSATVGDQLLQAVRAGLKESQLKLGQVQIPVEIRDGNMTLAKVEVETPEGRATFDALLDLQLFKIDSEWKIEAVGAGKSKDAAAASAKRYLPPVTVIYTGKLKDLGTAEPMVSVTELEREINVRRMERDVEELERLRKSDQQRAAQTAQRQKALEAEQARKAPATAPSNSIAPPGPGSALPNDGAPPVSEDATLNTDAANAAAAEGASTASPAPRPAVRKKRPETGWQPFQVTPY